MSGKRIGIFGGTFNPVHAGHTMLAQYVAEFGNVDEVWLTLSGQNPLKTPSGAVTDAQRLEMLRIACDDIPNVEPCDIELSLPRPSYTYRTLEALRSLYPDFEFSLIIGADNWTIFNRWRNAADIISNFSIIVYPRRGHEVDVASLPGNVTYLTDAPIIEVSSTFLRQAIGSGCCVNQFTPAGVYDYIKQHQLYGNNR